METKAMASTPTRPARNSRTIETRRAATTGSVAATQIANARVFLPASDAATPRASPARAVAIKPRRIARSVIITNNYVPRTAADSRGGHEEGTATADNERGQADEPASWPF